VNKIILAARHPLSLGCSAGYLRQYLKSIRKHENVLFDKVYIFFTGTLLQTTDVREDPILVKASYLMRYLKRYPTYFISDRYQDPISRYCRAIAPEYQAKKEPYSTGRNTRKKGSTVIPAHERVRTNPNLPAVEQTIYKNYSSKETAVNKDIVRSPSIFSSLTPSLPLSYDRTK
jgi:hypothetical protein